MKLFILLTVSTTTLSAWASGVPTLDCKVEVIDSNDHVTTQTLKLAPTRRTHFDKALVYRGKALGTTFESTLNLIGGTGSLEVIDSLADLGAAISGRFKTGDALKVSTNNDYGSGDGSNTSVTCTNGTAETEPFVPTVLTCADSKGKTTETVESQADFFELGHSFRAKFDRQTGRIELAPFSDHHNVPSGEACVTPGYPARIGTFTCSAR